MKSNVVEIKPEQPELAARSPEHAQLRLYLTTTQAIGQQEVQSKLEDANSVNSDLQRLETELAVARERKATALREDFPKWRDEVEFLERQLPPARERAAAASAAYAATAEKFNKSVVVETKNLLATALLPEARRIEAELDAVLNEQLAPKLRLLAAIQQWFVRERIPGAAVEILGSMRHLSDRFIPTVNNTPPGAAAEAELAALITTLNQ